MTDEKTKVDFEFFDVGEMFMEVINNENDEIHEEIMDLYKNINIVEITTLEVIEFFGFEEYFDDITRHLDHQGEDFLNKKTLLEN